MSTETPGLRSRRALLATGVAAAAASVLPALARPGQAQAANGDNVVLGQANAATLTTTVSVGGSSGPALLGSGSGVGVRGEGDTAVWGQSTGTNGVWGHSSAAGGYTGGTSGRSDSPIGAGVWGWAPNHGSGAMGISGADPTTEAPAKTGVYGYAAQDAAAVGVKGDTTVGTGVAAAATTGTALRVSGKAQFSRSGKASIAKGSRYTDITVAGGLTSHSVIHATLQTYRPGVAIAAVRANYPSSGKARIYLTKVASTTSSTRVGWFVAEY